MIEYRVRLADLNRHLIEVECRIDAPAAVERVSLPSWIPGSYLLREFARHIVAITAQSDNSATSLTKTDSSTWEIRGASGKLVVVIRVHALDLSVRGAYLDDQRGFFNGTCVYLRVERREAEPVSVVLERPSDERCAQWRVATAMTAVAIDAQGYGAYSVADYAELIDQPVEISEFVRVDFAAAGVPHALVLAGRHEADYGRLETDLRQLCETQIDFFGAPPPFDRYLFLGLAVDSGYGGLEHASSASLVFCADDLPKPGEPGMPREYQRLLSLCSHEYFHAWNVKRLKPAAFTPYRLNERNHTRLLWVFEGITSYYQDLLLLRAGLLGRDAYLNRLAQSLTRVYRTPGRAYQSLEESSFDAWDKLYKPEPNSGNATVSYYSKGALVALALDLTVRRQTRATVSLDTIMRALWASYQETGEGIGEPEFERVAQSVSGVDLTAFFDQAVRSTDDLPVAELLSGHGVALAFRAAASPTDLGGVLQADNNGGPLLTLGATYRDTDGGLELLSVRDAGPAERAGLCAGDIVVALDNRRVRSGNIAKRLARFEADESVPLTYFRRDELKQTVLQLSLAPADTCSLTIDENASKDAAALRAEWLG